MRPATAEGRAGDSTRSTVSAATSSSGRPSSPLPSTSDRARRRTVASASARSPGCSNRRRAVSRAVSGAMRPARRRGAPPGRPPGSRGEGSSFIAPSIGRGAGGNEAGYYPPERVDFRRLFGKLIIAPNNRCRATAGGRPCSTRPTSPSCNLLQANARISNADVARQLDMAPSAILDRIRKLEQRGVIQGYTARIDPAAVGLGLTAFILVRTEERVGLRDDRPGAGPHPRGAGGPSCRRRGLLPLKVRVADTAA